MYIDICGLLCVNKTNIACGFYRVMLLMYFRNGNGFAPRGTFKERGFIRATG